MSKLNVNTYSVTHDELTGLPNDFLFYDRLNTIISMSERSTSRLSVLYIKLKNIELIAKEHGVEAIDPLLINMAERLQDSLRDADTIARLDKFSFGVVLTHLLDTNTIDSLLYRIYKKLSRPFQIDERNVNVKIFMGKSIYPDNGMNATVLVSHAISHALNYD